MHKEETVAEIVTKDYRSAVVFKKYGIDFCCGGGKTLQEVCSKKGLDDKQIIQEIESEFSQSDSQSELDFNHMSLNALINYIVDNHHAYTRKVINTLEPLLDKVEKVHSSANPELKEINQVFKLLSRDLLMHMHKEEMILFPIISKMESRFIDSQPFETPPFGTIRNPIDMMEKEHDFAGNFMQDIRNLTREFTFPDHACNSFQVAYKLLAEFEQDLHKHVHLENNILFPKAIQLESENS